jgi:hypothetical protein
MERKKTFGRWKWAWPVHRPSLKRQRNGNKSIKRERERGKESPHQHAPNPRADAFISLFAIPSLSLLWHDDDDDRQQHRENEPDAMNG